MSQKENDSVIKTVLLAMRPPFLLLSVSIVILGSSIALYQGAYWSFEVFGWTLLGALLAHSAVNLLNEYQDFKSGLDGMTQKTPFSGGSGALPAHPEAAPYVWRAFLGVMGALIVLGGYLIALKGWALLSLGVMGVALILLYTTKITHWPWVCLVAPGVAFGPIMILGVYFVWTGTFSALALVLSFVPFFWVNNLLLLNQIPDVQADQMVGRRNILMQYGVHSGRWIFTGFAILAYLVVWGAYVYFQLPMSVLIAWVGGIVLIPMLKILFSSALKKEKLISLLAMNVWINIATPVLLALGLWLPKMLP